MNYLWHVVTLMLIYVVLGLSLNLISGLAGRLSLCHGALYGIGAYVTSLSMMRFGWGFIPSVIASSMATSVVCLLIAIPSLRLRGDYFVLATLGFQVIVYTVLQNCVSLTRGPYGIYGIPRPRIFGLDIDSPFRYVIFAAVITAASTILLWLIKDSPFGRVLRALRDDDTAAIALGKNATSFWTMAFVISSAFAAVAGGMYACYIQFIDPSSFALSESIFIVSILVVGGAGSLRGPVVGAVILVGLPEVLRFLNLPDAVAANSRQVIYGLMLVTLMRLRPRGLFGEYSFQ